MVDLLLPHAAFLLAIVVSEIALIGSKVQIGLKKILLVYTLIGSTTLTYLITAHGYGVVPFLIYWAGAFLSWFGVRSHIESSILLRVIYFLRKQPLKENDLLEQYNSYYGFAYRVEELRRAGLIESGPKGIRVTPKGKFVISVAALLR